jgi:hypothetical protein
VSLAAGDLAIVSGMGLDAVELVLRTEEFFVISIGDDEAASVRTVGDFYNLICTKLDVSALQSPVTPANLPMVTEKVFLFLQKQTPLPAPPEVLPWSPQSVWNSLVAVIVDQLCLEPGEVLYHARFNEDLRID